MITNLITALVTLGVVLYAQAFWQARRIRTRSLRSSNRTHRGFWI